MSNVISQFYGMTVLMSVDPTDEQPHFEVLYENKISKFSLSSGRMYSGDLIIDGQDIINEWFSQNKFPLQENWKRLLEKKPLKSIPAIE